MKAMLKKAKKVYMQTVGDHAAKMAAVTALLGVSASNALAAVPAAATTAITEAGADMLTAIGAVIAAMVAVWGLKKLGSKMGWL